MANYCQHAGYAEATYKSLLLLQNKLPFSPYSKCLFPLRPASSRPSAAAYPTHSCASACPQCACGCQSERAAGRWQELHAHTNAAGPRAWFFHRNRPGQTTVTSTEAAAVAAALCVPTFGRSVCTCVCVCECEYFTHRLLLLMMLLLLLPVEPSSCTCEWF